MEFFDFFEKSHFVYCSKTASNVFHDLKNVKIALKKFEKIGQFLPFLDNFSHIL
jgi:hypothetical protein